MIKFNQAKFESEAKKMVAIYCDIDEKDVSIVWFSKVGANAKAILSTSDDPKFDYFNVTYFGEKGQYIMTAHTYKDDDGLQLNEDEEEL